MLPHRVGSLSFEFVQSIIRFVAKICNMRNRVRKSSSEDDFAVLSHFEQKYKLHPILRTRQEKGEFHLLIKELLDSSNGCQVYFSGPV